MSLLRAKNTAAGGSNERASDMPTMRPVSMGLSLVTMSTYQERGETLKRTSIMPDDSCYRNNNNIHNNNNNNNNNVAYNNSSNRLTLTNGGSNSSSSNGNTELPPPPPQFANAQQSQLQAQSQSPQQQKQQPKQQQLQSQLKLNVPNSNGNLVASRSKQQQLAAPVSPMRSASINVGGLRAPATPQPDYDASTLQLRSNGQPIATTTTNGNQQQQQQQRRTLRLGTVTIGEYGEQRNKRETLRKMPSIGNANGGSAHSNGILKNGNRSSASFSSNINNSSSSSSSRQQLQHAAEKSIKFGN